MKRAFFMSETQDPIRYLAELDLPAQDLSRLKFCGGSRLSHVEQWLEGLQATRIAHTSAQLYQRLPELVHLKTDAKTRFAMLEAARPLVQSSVAGLAPEFIGQPLAGPAQKTAIVAQALQKALVDGYSLCVRELLRQRNLNTAGRRLLAAAIARSLFAIGRIYLRACQIYAQMPADLWLQAHNLYRAAERLELLLEPVTDPLLQWRRQTSIRDLYLQPVILACSRPNQLNPKDIDLVYQEAESWAQAAGLSDEVEPGNQNPFVINLSRDAAPVYKHLFDGSEEDHLLEPDFQQLWAELQREGRSSPALPSYLVNHLLEAWSKTGKRLQQRRQTKTAVDICLGLTECHYHLAGEKTFSDFTGGEDDPATPLERLMHGAQAPAARIERHPAHQAASPIRVSVLNISAGGYCLQWHGAMPDNAMAGQLLAVREAGGREWHLGVVRWVRQLRGASQMGVQILGLDVEPAAASIMYDLGGHSTAMRALRLAADEDGNPATLITAAVPFQEASHIRLESSGGVVRVRLERCLFSTSHMRRFTYRVTGTPDEGSRPAATPQSFDSEWD